MIKRLLLVALALTILVAIGLAVWEPLTVAARAADPARVHDVRIVRDRWGVPHIFGATDAATAYGIAYAHAEDDFPTIVEIFASVRGRGGALTGEAGAKIDFAAELLLANDAAAKGYAALSPATRALVEGYAAGLNRYAERHPGEVPLRKLFPVTGHDVVAGFALRSPFFFGLDRTLGALVDGKLPPRDGTPAGERGSNAFAIAPKKSADGIVRLVANSHQPWEGGVAWYELVVHSQQGWDFAGATFPGAPFPLLGHNRTLGWTNTVNRPDLIDTYKLVLNTAGDAYRFDGAWRKLERRRLWLRVKAGPFVLPIPRTLERSVHGPVIRNELDAFAIRYANFGDVRQVETYYRLNKARDFGEWRAALSTGGIPATNFVYADAAGHIALFHNARFPARAPGFDWRGVLPGDTSRALWTRYVPYARLPQLIDPPAGWVANANNTPFIATAPADDLLAANFAPELGIETFMPNRAHRFSELFAAHQGPLSRADLLRIKFDKGYSRAGWAGGWVAKLLAVRDPRLADAQALLRTWDWTLDGRGRADALAYELIAGGARAGYVGDVFPEPGEVFVEGVAALTATFGRLDPPLGALVRLRRGTVDLPLAGGPDALRAIYAKRPEDGGDGRRIGYNGDSFIQWVEWDRGTLRSWSIQPFGAATVRTGSPHYADQAARFAAERWKPVWFEAAALKSNIAREYRP